ncbi:hypothetical protein VFPFJ_04753 [Purpureocillium lilacinum]|uniref:Uncharacterized protein n=1 Tax=Purpureocillium lilacinum TaxID=33203 RepID=A0A179HKR1_PURLI|nr:hypothetical protein VFPFJ_04753 [Purpureocillium lilacinum]OAQ90594.1 hypothetical protein VFPFJ_04753 [Purpureocillium lilacinum]
MPPNCLPHLGKQVAKSIQRPAQVRHQRAPSSARSGEPSAGIFSTRASMDPFLLDPFFSFSDSAAVIAQRLRCSEVWCQPPSAGRAGRGLTRLWRAGRDSLRRRAELRMLLKGAEAERGRC